MNYWKFKYWSKSYFDKLASFFIGSFEIPLFISYSYTVIQDL